MYVYVYTYVKNPQEIIFKLKVRFIILYVVDSTELNCFLNKERSTIFA